jgi:hypothetical protein
VWSIFFPQLEKIYKKINVEDWQNNYPETLRTDLDNYHPLRKMAVKRDFELYSPSMYKYDDISINLAATGLIKSYEEFVEPFFENYKDLATLEKELNRLPLEHHFYIGYGGRQIAIGLTLGKKFQKDNFETLKRTYQEYILNDKYGEEFKEKMQRYFDSAVSFLGKIDVNNYL